jgi:hypothetical protein
LYVTRQEQHDQVQLNIDGKRCGLIQLSDTKISLIVAASVITKIN